MRYAFMALGLLMFALAYHNLDLAYNNKFSLVDLGNGLDGWQMHTLGLVQSFISVSLLCIGILLGEKNEFKLAKTSKRR